MRISCFLLLVTMLVVGACSPSGVRTLQPQNKHQLDDECPQEVVASQETILRAFKNLDKGLATETVPAEDFSFEKELVEEGLFDNWFVQGLPATDVFNETFAAAPREKSERDVILSVIYNNNFFRPTRVSSEHYQLRMPVAFMPPTAADSNLVVRSHLDVVFKVLSGTASSASNDTQEDAEAQADLSLVCYADIDY